MKKIIIASLILFGLFIIPNKAFAMFIFETPEPSNTLNGLFLRDTDWIYQDFRIDNNYNVTGIEGWIGVNSGSITMAIYPTLINPSGSAVPNLSNPIFEQQVAMTTNFPAGWQGIDSLNFDIGLGNYWAGFEVRQTDSFAGAMWRNNKFSDPIFDGTVYAYNPNNGIFVDRFNENNPSERTSIGLRVQGDLISQSNVIPEPATMLLFGGGMMGALAARRRRKRL